MSWTSIVAIYALFWVLTAFVVLPIGVRTHDELGLAKVAGQADSAPANFNPKQILLRTTLLSAALFGLYYANYTYGWLDRHSFDFLVSGPN
jgi:predicted secreted protein